MSSSSSDRTASASGNPTPAGANGLSGAHHFVSMKLTHRNFLLWRTQIISFLRGQELFGYVDGSYPCPPATIAAPSTGTSDDATASIIPNPAFKAWEKQDQSIFSLLVSSMADEVLHLAVGKETSAAVWSSITSALGSSSQARCLSLLGQFQVLQQGHSTNAEYLGRAQLLVEALAQAGRSLSLME
ncbi:PREDICTED: uncharacterized protein LOC109164846 [Ipomoea nil]|uniref:uncharacterized protein LOC109164846 n=1 Tax=Ipomoea nil TaxID=35883 RepID=UPI000900BF94|nr:PREDICTED: uncharacterized protein LOC109164846 [Ipomoea nil]